MNMLEYLDTLTSQIRCKKARPAVREEIKSHMEDQIDAYIRNGMSPQSAQTEALRQMGDPVDAGVQLDRIHRPHLEWKLLLMIGCLSLLGLLLQYMICDPSSSFELFQNQCIFTLIGLISMAAVYFIDYSIIGKYAIPLWTLFSAVSILMVLTFQTVHGGYLYLQSLMYLFVPLNAGILFHYRNCGYSGLIKSIFFILISILFTVRVIGSLVTGAELSLICITLVTIAIKKNWFLIRKKTVLAMIWLFTLLTPIAFIPYMKPYQITRLKNIFSPLADPNGFNYTRNAIHTLLRQSILLGKGDLIQVPAEVLPEISSDYVLIYVFSYYGILAGAVIIALIGYLIIKVFHISIHQSNQLGMMIGTGCGLVMAVATIHDIGTNLGILPIGSIGIPFFSYGFTLTLVTYLLLGLLLSIYRHKDIITGRNSKPKYRLQIKINKINTD